MQPSTPVEGTIEQGAEEVTVAIENPDSVAIQTDDGGMIISDQKVFILTLLSLCLIPT